MRYLIILFAALSLSACKELDIKKVEYHSTTMMGKTIIAVTQDSVTVDFNGRGEPSHFARETKSSEWVDLLKSLAEVDLDKISELEAPSNKRASDAAPYGRFVIQGKDKSYTSSDFDGKNPNEVLMPAMKVILQIEEENKK